MIKAGFVDELKKLYARPDLNADLASMRAVGYRQVWNYLDGKDELDWPVDFAAVYMGLGLKDKVLECFETMDYGPELAWAQIDAIFQGIVLDPRFRDLMREKNMPGYE